MHGDKTCGFSSVPPANRKSTGQLFVTTQVYKSQAMTTIILDNPVLHRSIDESSTIGRFRTSICKQREKALLILYHFLHDGHDYPTMSIKPILVFVSRRQSRHQGATSSAHLRQHVQLSDDLLQSRGQFERNDALLQRSGYAGGELGQIRIRWVFTAGSELGGGLLLGVVGQVLSGPVGLLGRCQLEVFKPMLREQRSSQVIER